MERRHLNSGFVGGAYVFPGGRVDDADAIPEGLCKGLSEAQANQRLGLDCGGLSYFVAALRECFEEAGVLLAYAEDGQLLDFSAPDVEDLYRTARDQLNAGKLGFQELLERERLVLATDRMHYWSHWITPFGEKRRYDTRFFAAEAPENQTATHDDWELTSSAWVEPGTALDKAMAREWMIIFPTLHTLKGLEGFANITDALSWASGDQPRPINLPKNFEGCPVIPGDPGYEQADEDISSITPASWFTGFKR